PQPLVLGDRRAAVLVGPDGVVDQGLGLAPGTLRGTDPVGVLTKQSGIEHMASLSGSDPAEQAVYRRVAAPVRIDPPPVTGRPTATPRNARRPTRPDGLSVVRGWAHYGAPAAFRFLDRDHREHPRCLRRVDPAGPVLGPAGRVRPAGRPATDHARLAGRPDRLGDLVR